MPTTTAQMGLSIPTNGETDYPTSVSNSFTEIDTHDHTTGNGVQIPTGGIVDLAVTTAKINALAVTRAKLAAVGQQISSSCNGFTTASTTPVDVTNLSVTITTTGRPVYVGLIHDGTANNGIIGFSNVSFGGAISYQNSYFYLLRDATTIHQSRLRVANGTTSGVEFVTPASIFMIDTPVAGTYTYKMQAAGSSDNGTATVAAVTYVKLIAYEL